MPDPDWYRQSQEDHSNDLRQPQRFPLTGDGLVTQRVITTGPFNGPDIGDELATARYRDYQFQHQSPTAEMESKMPNPEADQQADTYWENLVNRTRQTEQNAQAYAVAQRAAPQQPEAQSQAEVEHPRLTLQ